MPCNARMIAAAVLVFAAGLPFGFADTPTTAKPAATGSLFRPGDFKSLGKLVVTSGQTITFDTGSSTTQPSAKGAITGQGSLGISKSGKVQVAVFAFDEIQLAEGAKVEVTGSRGLVLLSRGAAVINTTIDVSGQLGAKEPTRGKQADGTLTNPGGKGGPGGEGGEYQKTFASDPPPENGGDGGPAMKDNGRPGHGYGAGFNQRVKGGTGGGGGAYGGTGGDASEGSGNVGKPPHAMPGGKTYGDAPLSDLFGGSGGAGASNDRNFSVASGGGGGGALAIVALGGITFGEKSKALADGGPGAVNKACGGGGSGGAILLAAPTVVLKPGSVLSARGGDGGDGGPAVAAQIKPEIRRRDSGSGGGGGGGRIAIYSNANFAAAGKNQTETKVPEGIVVTGGKGGSMAKDGSNGTFYDGTWPGLR